MRGWRPRRAGGCRCAKEGISCALFLRRCGRRLRVRRRGGLRWGDALEVGVGSEVLAQEAQGFCQLIEVDVLAALHMIDAPTSARGLVSQWLIYRPEPNDKG